MATVMRGCALERVARMLGEDLERMGAFVSKGDNRSCRNIISVHTGTEESATVPTARGIGELRRHAR